MATLIKRLSKWYYSHRECSLKGSGFTGMIQAYAGSSDNVPIGWLLCDGTEYSISEYSALYDVIGNIYGGTAGSTFCVPDLRECTVVGAGENTTDSVGMHDEYALGEFKNDQLQHMTGYVGRWPDYDAYNGGVLVRYSAVGGGGGNNNNGTVSGIDFDNARVVRTGSVTHGKQKGINYIIHV